MSNHHDDDDFAPTMTAGYKPGEKKSVNELQNLDAHDESLVRWKQSLGISSSGVSKLDDPNNVAVLQLALEVAGRPDVILDLTKSETELKNHSFTIKEGVEYRLKVLFRVQHEVVSGLKYMQVVKRKGIRGKYNEFLSEEAPSGMLARGHYEATSKFVDDDGTVHKQWSWSFDIKKDW
ncbi:hypothetical protein BGZ52_007432 [Haplosporangium bisporale]|nr:hypothetical protein BGZ52_007432 [Haplosporangium bisporale]